MTIHDSRDFAEVARQKFREEASVNVWRREPASTDPPTPIEPIVEKRGSVWFRVLSNGVIEICPTKAIINGAPVWQPYPNSVPANELARLYIEAKRVAAQCVEERRELAEKLAQAENIITELRSSLDVKKPRSKKR